MTNVAYIFAGKYSWLPTRRENVSSLIKDAVIGGCTNDGSLTYVGRVLHKENEIPASIIPEIGAALFIYENETIISYNFDILLNTNPCNVSAEYLQWIRCNKGLIPTGALASGRSKLGEILYIGRVLYKGLILVGTIHPRCRICIFSYEGTVYSLSVYEALVLVFPNNYVVTCKGKS